MSRIRLMNGVSALAVGACFALAEVSAAAGGSLAAVQRAARAEATSAAEDEEDPEKKPDEEDPDKKPEDEETETVTTTTTTASAERARILGIQAAMFTGQDELAAAMIADGKTTPEQAALRFNRALRAAGVTGPTQLAQLEAMDQHVRVPANQRGGAGGVKPGAKVPQTEAGWKAEFEGSAELQAEFATAEDYVALRKAEVAGRVRVLARKTG